MSYLDSITVPVKNIFKVIIMLLTLAKLFFFLEKEKQAEAKFEALKMQIQLVRNFARQLSQYNVA